MKELFIDRGITQNRAALMHDGILSGIYIENIDCNNINGNIYKGRIENLVQGLNAAFVNIGIGKNAILHYESAEGFKEVKRGQEVLVQITREGIGSKGPKVSTNISIPGKYLVVLPDSDYIGVSKKIEDAGNREKLRNLAKRIYMEGYGIILRTEALEIDEDEIYKEYIYLKDILDKIYKKVNFIKAPQILFDVRDFAEYIFREFIKNDIDKINVNSEGDYTFIKEKLGSVNSELSKKIFYNEFNFSISDMINKEIEKIHINRIELPSGGYIIIDVTEAFTCIDINSGSFSKASDTILKTNLEACSVISNIIRLRNLSGIILIDFIDMEIETDQRCVLEKFQSEFQFDKQQVRIFGFTKLGIIEMTRAKKGKRISEFIFERENSVMFTPSYCLKLIENNCARLSKHYKRKTFNIYLAQYIYGYEDMLSYFINEMKRIYGITISFIKSDFINSYYIVNDDKDEDLVRIELNGNIITGKVVKFEDSKNGTSQLEFIKL